MTAPQVPTFTSWSLSDVDDVDALNERLRAETASHVILLDHGTALEAGALDAIADAISRFPAAVAYGDSRENIDGVDVVVRRPAGSPLRFRQQDYLGGLRVVDVAAARDADGFRAVDDAEYADDLAFRIAEAGGDMLCIARVLSNRTVRPQGQQGRLRRVSDLLARRGITAESSADGSLPDLRYPVSGEPLVSIIIPSRGGTAPVRGRNTVMLVDAVRSIVVTSTWQNYEIVVVADLDMPVQVEAEVIRLAGARARFVPWPSAFDFAAKVNLGAIEARGDYLLFLNDDVEVISPDWIERMLGLAQQAGVGIVGALLYFEDGTVQHGGHIYRDGAPTHAAFGWAADRDDLLHSMRVDREVAGVTAACALIERELFLTLGGMSLEFPHNYNDVDLCLKVRRSGRTAIWSPHARLFHFESKSRDPSVKPAETRRLARRWASRIEVDEYWPQR
jgi:glycosyltransferase involved in cell wall biosynthesis